MDELAAATREAVALLVGGDRALRSIIGLSFSVSLRGLADAAPFAILLGDLKRAGTRMVLASRDPEPVAVHADLYLELVDGHLQRYAPYTSAVVPLRPPGHPKRHESR